MNINNLYEVVILDKIGVDENNTPIRTVGASLRPVTRESIEAFLREQHKELKEECERLEKVAKFWRQEYYKLNPPYTPPKIDNL